MTLHFSQIALTLGRTFTISSWILLVSLAYAGAAAPARFTSISCSASILAGALAARAVWPAAAEWLLDYL
jgi:hypothetical protein